MRRARWGLIFGLGLAVTGSGSAVAQTIPTGSPDAKLILTIQVYNYAGVDQKTLAEAEVVVGQIFRKAGVQTRCVEVATLSDNKRQVSRERRPVDLTEITVNLLPQAMAGQFQMSNEVMGLAPGTGRNRYVVYVFYDRVEAVMRALAGFDKVHARTSEIVGHAIVHEIGHILLNMQGHTGAGIMRGSWSREDLLEVARGNLSFTPQQAEVLRAEVIRRVKRQTAEISEPAFSH